METSYLIFDGLVILLHMYHTHFDKIGYIMKQKGW